MRGERMDEWVYGLKEEVGRGREGGRVGIDVWRG